MIKKWAKKYDVLLCSDALMKLVPTLLGKILAKIGKFPFAITENENLEAKVDEMKKSVRF